MKEQPSNPNQTPVQPPTQVPTQPPAPTAEQYSKEKMKRKRTSKAALLLVLTILLAVAGYVAYTMLMKEDTPTDTTAPQANSVDKSAATIMKETRDYVGSTIKKSYPKLIIASPQESSISVVYRSPGSAYFVMADAKDGLEISRDTVDPYATDPEVTEEDEAFYTEMVSHFVKEQRLARIKQKAPDIQSSENSFQSDSVQCDITSGIGTVRIGCMDKFDLDRLSADLKPFATVLKEQNKLVVNSILGAPVIKDSSVDGFKSATINMGAKDEFGGAVGLFYKKGAKDWKFFTSAQNVLRCSDYNTDDLKNAFAGEECGTEESDSLGEVEPAKQQ